MCRRTLIRTIVFLALFLIKYSDSEEGNLFEVPEPKFEVFAKGFRVTIPDEAGIELFAFHGNINRPMVGLEAGQYSKDILKKKGDTWIFEDKEAKLKVGDVIYYWLYVMRYKLGFRYDDGKFMVKDISSNKSQDRELASYSHKNSGSNWYFEPIGKPGTIFGAGVQITTPTEISTERKPCCSEPTAAPKVQTNPTIQPETKPISMCCQLFLDSTKHIISLSEQVDKLVEENKILSELAQKDDHYSKTLRIFGKYPMEYYTTPKEFAQNLVSEKLKLTDVTVLEAKKIPDNGISFKVETVSDKVKIILAAKKNLQGSNYELSW